MELKVINIQGMDAGVLEVNEAVFAREYNEALVHQVVNAFLANARSGNRAQKTRAQVAKSTRKPWKQKGTGRARAGMASSPLWRGGGRIFPNSPEENFSQKINRKMYRAALASIISQLVRDNRFIVADTIDVDSPKTKNFAQILKNMSFTEGRLLVIVSELSENLFLATRNLSNVLVLESHQVDPYSLVRFDKVLFAKSAVEELQEQFA
ncbi:MAG: ribosomal protein [Burkholderiales bacterium]|jgi:large subunit ribosomal protein L4|nr:ribosomal protein [Burkholderiales bacterium]MCE3269115.1 ribosomal protein [Burkholderiales bacterium]